MKTPKVVSFYESLLEVMGIYVTDDGYLYKESSSGNDDTEYVALDGTRFRLPVEGYSSEMVKEDETGRMVPQFYLFNPLSENQLDINQPDLNLLRDAISRQISGSCISAFIAASDIVSSDTSTSGDTIVVDLISATADLLNTMRSNAIVGDKTWVKKVGSLAKEFYKDTDISFIDLVMKPGNKNSTAVLDMFNTLLDLLEEDTDNRIMGVSLRSKDKAFAEVVLNTIFDTNPITYSTKIKNSGMTRVLLDAYIDIGKKVNAIISASTIPLDGLNVTDVVKLGKEISGLASEVKLLPPPSVRIAKSSKAEPKLQVRPPAPQAHVVEQVNDVRSRAPQMSESNNDDSELSMDDLNRVLNPGYGSGYPMQGTPPIQQRPVYPPQQGMYPQQQPAYPQQQPMYPQQQPSYPQQQMYPQQAPPNPYQQGMSYPQQGQFVGGNQQPMYPQQQQYSQDVYHPFKV